MKQSEVQSRVVFVKCIRRDGIYTFSSHPYLAISAPPSKASFISASLTLLGSDVHHPPHQGYSSLASLILRLGASLLWRMPCAVVFSSILSSAQ